MKIHFDKNKLKDTIKYIQGVCNPMLDGTNIELTYEGAVSNIKEAFLKEDAVYYYGILYTFLPYKDGYICEFSTSVVPEGTSEYDIDVIDISDEELSNLYGFDILEGLDDIVSVFENMDNSLSQFEEEFPEDQFGFIQDNTTKYTVH